VYITTHSVCDPSAPACAKEGDDHGCGKNEPMGGLGGAISCGTVWPEQSCTMSPAQWSRPALWSMALRKGRGDHKPLHTPMGSRRELFSPWGELRAELFCNNVPAMFCHGSPSRTMVRETVSRGRASSSLGCLRCNGWAYGCPDVRTHERSASSVTMTSRGKVSDHKSSGIPMKPLLERVLPRPKC
jgi:hypothetical protein